MIAGIADHRTSLSLQCFASSARYIKRITADANYGLMRTKAIKQMNLG